MFVFIPIFPPLSPFTCRARYFVMGLIYFFSWICIFRRFGLSALELVASFVNYRLVYELIGCMWYQFSVFFQYTYCSPRVILDTRNVATEKNGRNCDILVLSLIYHKNFKFQLTLCPCISRKTRSRRDHVDSWMSQEAGDQYYQVNASRPGKRDKREWRNPIWKPWRDQLKIKGKFPSFLYSAGNELDYRRYVEVLFDILIAGWFTCTRRIFRTRVWDNNTKQVGTNFPFSVLRLSS